MPRLSNFFRPRDPSPGEIICRPIQRQEIESALRLVLANDNGLAGDEAVLDFLGFAMQRKIDLNQMWIAQMGDRIAWALLPISSPGRTMLLFTPTRIPHATPLIAVQQLTDELCSHWRTQDVHLAQFLLDPHDQAVCDLYTNCGFEVLAELIYLQKTFRGPMPDPILPAGFELNTYTPETHRAFAEAIQLSYEGSLDCPSLNGKRSIDDVISGHKATGSFDPSLWYVVTENAAPRAVLILSPSSHNDSVELVYLGLAPQARGRGIGDALMRLAISTAAKQQRSDLSLAVDSKNEPALKLYFRHGLRKIGSRLALLRDLRGDYAASR